MVHRRAIRSVSLAAALLVSGCSDGDEESTNAAAELDALMTGSEKSAIPDSWPWPDSLYPGDDLTITSADATAGDPPSYTVAGTTDTAPDAVLEEWEARLQDGWTIWRNSGGQVEARAGSGSTFIVTASDDPQGDGTLVRLAYLPG